MTGKKTGTLNSLHQTGHSNKSRIDVGNLHTRIGEVRNKAMKQQKKSTNQGLPRTFCFAGMSAGHFRP
jgi:hypothetical protein